MSAVAAGGAVARVVAAWGALWRTLRALSGDDAYERYLEHRARVHPGAPVLSRREFYVDEQRRRWGTINRCC
ncbi:MAG TPA: YbdD/YjiX family protein [Steroidobacteraceae bacterium]|nr:YbdD/YjiX family protein [Steroidobacteraceae bacterium]